ncbi:hypothetical protein [Segniliparus rotundus]|nr:hypothetical protein [Segniliparus rotundus]
MSALAVVFFAGLAGLWDLYILGAAVMGYDSCGAGHRCNAALGTAGLVVSAVVFCGGLLLMLVGVARYAFGKRDARIWHGVGAAALLLSGFVGAVLIGQSAGVPFIDVGALRA